MSYILDALRKSERERSRGSIAKLETPGRHAGDPGRALTLFLGTLLVLLLVFVGAVAWIYRDSLRVLSTAAQTPRLEIPATDSATEAGEALVVDSTIMLSAVPTATPGSEPAVVLAPAESTPAESAESTHALPSLGPPMPPGPLASAEPVDRSRLPREVQAQLPPLKVSVLSYSEHVERRFAMIDERIYREGDWLSDELRVERVLPDRIVLSGARGRFFVSP